MSAASGHAARSTGYDRIAHLYDADMAQNMRFDDVGFYAQRCATWTGPVLELGCGNGRILLALAACGIDGWGVDGSAPMLAELERKASARGIMVRTACADIRSFALPARFSTVLLPYSLVTYLVGDDDVDAAMQCVRAHLAPRGHVVLDAFVPRPVAFAEEFRLDYRRPFGQHILRRSKRVRPAATGLNTIERRYEIVDAHDEVLSRIDVCETIRPRSPDDLRELARNAGLRVDGEWWDYGAGAAADAQFFTLSAVDDRSLPSPAR